MSEKNETPDVGSRATVISAVVEQAKATKSTFEQDKDDDEIYWFKWLPADKIAVMTQEEGIEPFYIDAIDEETVEFYCYKKVTPVNRAIYPYNSSYENEDDYQNLETVILPESYGDAKWDVIYNITVPKTGAANVSVKYKGFGWSR